MLIQDRAILGRFRGLWHFCDQTVVPFMPLQSCLYSIPVLRQARSAGVPTAEAANKAAMQLPERVMMALVQTPAMFAVPNCINKGFAPPFIVRVGVVSAVPTQIKATIAGYVLQKEQVCAGAHLAFQKCM